MAYQQQSRHACWRHTLVQLAELHQIASLVLIQHRVVRGCHSLADENGKLSLCSVPGGSREQAGCNGMNAHLHEVNNCVDVYSGKMLGSGEGNWLHPRYVKCTFIIMGSRRTQHAIHVAPDSHMKDRHTDRQMDSQMYVWTDGEIDRQAGRQAHTADMTCLAHP